MEVKRIPLPDYIEKVEKDVSVNMRGVLVDWLVEVSEEYNHLPESLYLTISYIDRYLSLNVLNRQNFSFLVFLQCSLHQISPPHTEDFCDITDNTYTKEDVVRMEAEVLKTLNFEMGIPHLKRFLGDLLELSKKILIYGSRLPVKEELKIGGFGRFLLKRLIVLCAYMESDELFHSELREVTWSSFLKMLATIALTSLKKVIMYEALLSFFVTDIPLLSYEVDSFVMFLLKSERSWRLNRVFIVMLQHSYTSPLNIEISGFVTFTAELDYVNLL
ncbi:G2/mitotic-specific cyclin C13-1-like protein [Tanacetum coccineum]